MQLTTRRFLVSLFLFVFAAAYFYGRSSATQSPVATSGDDDYDKQLICELNDSIQERFKDVDKTFGYRRIIRVGETPHRFKPETAKELEIVDELKKARLKVALYLAGRSVLQANPSRARFDPKWFIKGPGLVTVDDDQKKSLPDSSDLFEQSRKAMLSFETSESYDFTLAGRKFTARPVRASDQSCLMCHASEGASFFPSAGADKNPKPLKMGDVLGVVIYSYERSR